MADPAGLRRVFDGVLSGVSTATQARMSESAEVVDLAPGDRVFSEGETADALYVVMSGTIQLSTHQRERNLAVASVGPGELLGWSWLVPPHRWDFDAIAVVESRLARIPAGLLRSAMQDDPADAAALSGAMLNVVSRRLRDTRIQLLDLFARADSGSAT